ncbi:uncharacterized protein LOC144759902 [Lissotriton helveticus]
MGRRRAPEKKAKAQCSRESVRATVPSFPVLDVSALRSRNDAQRDQDKELLSENLPHIILLSMLEELEAKLENLMNTVEDVPSRVAGLIKKIWIEKDLGFLDNGAVSLEVVCPASIRDCAVSQSPATPQPGSPGEPSLCLQSVFSDGHAPKQDCTLSSPTHVQVRPEEPSICLQPLLPDLHGPQQDQSMQPVFSNVHESQQDLCFQPDFTEVHESKRDQCFQPGFPDVHESQQDQCMQPGFPDGNGLQLDCTLSRCPHTDPPGRSLGTNRCLQYEFVDGQTPQQDQSVQSAFPEKREPDEPLKQEPSPLSANSWDQKQKLCPHPLFPEGHEQQQNHCIQPALPDGKRPDDHLEEELMCFDFQDTQENRRLQPVSPDGMSSDEHLESWLFSFGGVGSQQTQCLQQHLCLKQELPHAQDPNVNYELEPMRPEAQEPEQKDKLEQTCAGAPGSDQKYKLEPPCPEERGQSVPPSFLGLDTNTADEDSMEIGNTKSHLFLFEATPAQQSHLESMNGKESHKGPEGKMNFTQNIYFKKRRRMHMRERRFACNVCEKGFIKERLLVRHKKGHTSLRQYPCETCKKCFTQKATFLQHQRTHTGERPYHCTVCSKSFAYKKGLVRYQSVHTGERPHQSLQTVERPHQSLHTGERPHQSLHTGERPHHCTVCAKSFTQMKILLQHQRIHTGEKPFHCTLCEKSYNHKATLLKHELIHTGERPYHCTMCEKTFNQKEYLLQHQRKHTGERPYHCTEAMVHPGHDLSETSMKLGGCGLRLIEDRDNKLRIIRI